MTSKKITRQDLHDAAQKYKNWGKWGPNDEIGTLNYTTPADIIGAAQLVRKGKYPHLLVMTATPIPRTLGLTLYGELDISAIDELPPGRGRVKTLVRAADKLPKVWSFVREKLAAGRQAYVVYPRVEDTGDSGT